jgi:hypothetical protein
MYSHSHPNHQYTIIVSDCNPVKLNIYGYRIFLIHSRNSTYTYIQACVIKLPIIIPPSYNIFHPGLNYYGKLHITYISTEIHEKTNYDLKSLFQKETVLISQYFKSTYLITLLVGQPQVLSLSLTSFHHLYSHCHHCHQTFSADRLDISGS